MGNLDGRIAEDKDPEPKATGGVKDGATGLVDKKAPDEKERADLSQHRAPDIIHGGDQHKSTSKSGA